MKYVHFESAPVEKLGELKTAFFDVIKKVVEDGIDMERMESVIHREYLKVSCATPSLAHIALHLVAHQVALPCLWLVLVAQPIGDAPARHAGAQVHL